jgi:hypothetical protein
VAVDPSERVEHATPAPSEYNSYPKRGRSAPVHLEIVTGSGDRTRGLTATSGYNATGAALSGHDGSGGRINKRRHGTPETLPILLSVGNSPTGRYALQPYSHPNRPAKQNPYR